MLASFDTAVRFVERTESRRDDYNLAPTTFEEATWKEMALALSRASAGPTYLALIVFDQSSESRKVRDLMTLRYRDLDRISGDELVVLSSVPPPRDWYDTMVARLKGLPDWARRIQRREALALTSAAGQENADANSAKLIASFFEESTRFPVLCLLDFTPQPDEEAEVEAISFELDAFTDEEAFLGLWRYLAETVRTAANSGKSFADLARDANALGNPRSLRWRVAVRRTVGLFSFAQRWYAAFRGLVPV